MGIVISGLSSRRYEAGVYSWMGGCRWNFVSWFNRLVEFFFPIRLERADSFSIRCPKLTDLNGLPISTTGVYSQYSLSSELLLR